jgi:hypothetical protein
MPLNTLTVEQVTAITNIPLGAIATVAAVCLWNWRRSQPLKALLWAGMFASLMVASDLAMYVHGFKLEPATSKLLWHAIKAALGLTVACFAAGAVFDRWGADATRRVAPGLLALSAGFFAYATFVSQTFRPFIVYEGVAMLFCLSVYLTLTVQRRLAGAAWMVAGVGITLLAAALQTMPAVVLRLGATFDHNGVFHLVQLPGLLCLLAGLRISLAPKPERDSNARGMSPEALRFL